MDNNSWIQSNDDIYEADLLKNYRKGFMTGTLLTTIVLSVLGYTYYVNYMKPR